MRFVLLLISFVFISNAVVAKEKQLENSYKSYFDIPYFVFEDLEFKHKQKEFMNSVLQKLQKRLVPAPKSIKYLDKNDNVTRKSLEKYKELAKKHVTHVQKRKFFKYNKNNDQEISLSEFSEKEGFNGNDVANLYDSVKKYGFKNFGKHAHFLKVMDVNRTNKNRSANSFLENNLPTFIELDLNSDKILSFAEIGNPSQTALKKETEEKITIFESLLSLSEDGNKTTLEQVSKAAQRSFNTLDYNRDGVISNKESARFSNAKLSVGKSSGPCQIASFIDKKAPIYVMAVGNSNATTSVEFHGTFSKFTGFTQVNIEKQNKPLNLVLGSNSDMIWSLAGNTSSIQSLLVFGPGDKEDISAGIVGIPKNKIKFLSSEKCWNLRVPSTKAKYKDKKNFILRTRGVIKHILGQQPHLIKMQARASKIKIKSDPEILFFKDISDELKKRPNDFNNEYWNKFLKWKSSGHKIVDFEKIVFGSYATEAKIPPYWAGIAQLEKDGVISPLNIDKEKRRSVFLLNKDLLEFPGVANLNPTTFSFITSNKFIKYPETKHNWRAGDFCIMSKKGKVLYGKNYCSISDIAFLQPNDNKLSSLDMPAYLSISPFIPVLPANKDSVDLKLKIDEESCKRQYKSSFKEKCKIPDDLIDRVFPAYALNIEPSISGKLSWKNKTTITFTPDDVWRAGALYTFSLNLDHMSLPKGLYVNNERQITTKFYADTVSVKASNVQINDDPHDVSIQILTADLTSNYPLRDVTVEPVYIPKDAIEPDEHFISVEGYKFYYTKYTNNAQEFDMPNMRRTLKKIIHKREDGLMPTHVTFKEPQSAFASDVMFSRPVWVKIKIEDNENISDEVKKILVKATKGNSDAQIELGTLYYTGGKVPKSLSRARYWFTKAANQNDLKAYVALGRLNNVLYFSGHDDRQRAFIWYSKAAEGNNKIAQYKLGKIHGDNRSYYHNYEESRKRFKQSAKQGYVPALVSLGAIYEYGKGVEVGYKKAMDFYLKAAEKDSPEALARISRLYLLGLGVKQDSDKAYEYAHKALSLAKRNDFNTRNITRRVVSEILIEQFSTTKDFDVRIHLIANKVFKDFSKDYVRMWIAQGIVRMWDGGNQSHRIAEEIVLRQKEKTPSLPEMEYVRADIILNDGYRLTQNGIEQYRRKNLNDAIKIFESIKGFKILEVDVINRLIALYLSKGDIKAVKPLIDNAKIERYFSVRQLSGGLARYARYKGDYLGAMHFYDQISDEYNLAQVSLWHGNTDKMEKVFKNIAINNPEHAWSQGNYAMFLLYTMHDYNNAIIYGEKALKIMTYPMALSVTGMAYLVKASQLNIKDGLSMEVMELINKARSYGVNKWYIKDNCSKFCGDIARMLKSYKTFKAAQPI